jgi:hypothetical protein
MVSWGSSLVFKVTPYLQYAVFSLLCAVFDLWHMTWLIEVVPINGEISGYEAVVERLSVGNDL